MLARLLQVKDATWQYQQSKDYYNNCWENIFKYAPVVSEFAEANQVVGAEHYYTSIKYAS